MDSLIHEVVDEIKQVRGVKAVVLGGSRARGTHHPGSDYDIGIYYDSAKDFDIDELAKVAARLDDDHRQGLVTPIGGWGPWINGGGWLHIHSNAVDFIYRDLNKVNQVIDDCLAGKLEIYYQPGHPFGFPTYIYLGEAAVCQPLWDREGCIADLKKRVTPYPLPFKKAVIEKFFWEIDFSIGNAKKSVAKVDVSYAAACCFRSAMCMLQVLFALNNCYWLNEKGAVQMAEQFEIVPENFKKRINMVFSLLNESSSAIEQSVKIMQGLNEDVGGLVHKTG